MKNKESHITGYPTYAYVLIILLALTTISVAATGYHLGAYTVALALLIASIKVATVISYFMHLRSESLFLKVAVSGVFLIFTLVIIITFFDYLFR
jgi:cytochrome c oxidase subunit IV